jgi:uncharacterized protein (TIGR03790 family)
MKNRADIFRNWFCRSLVFALLAVTRVCLADGGESVVVVYNSLVPESKEVAEHYAKLRQVPANQILGLELPAGETMSRQEFRDGLQKPLFRWLEKQKLFVVRLDTQPAADGVPAKTFWRVKESKIRYAVLCYGVPARIASDPDLREPGAEKIAEPVRRNGAAVDSELTLLPMNDFKLMVTGPLLNPFYRATNSAALNPTNGILMVSRLDGPSAAIARGLVDKAIEAETEGLWGRAYFDLRGITNAEYKLGDEWMNKAAEFSRRAGFETIVDQKEPTFSAAFPLSAVAIYCGWYDGNVSGPFTRANVEFMPGAIAYHLHSFSAQTIRSATQHWVGPLLAKGATATMGCVDEPYLNGTPDVGEFFGRILALGFTFGEAAWASQPALSWQTAVVGDPLYRPFGKPPQQQHEFLAAKKSKLIEWSHLRVVNLNQVNNFPIAEIVSYLEETGKESPVLMEKLGDLYQQQGKTWAAINAYAQALNLQPGPQQEIRLLLTLAEKLEAAKRDAEALAMCKLLLKKAPDYPDPLPVYKQMVALAKKANSAEEAEAFQKEIQRLSK